MSRIHVLNQDTINKIAAGEVIERPMAVAKELVENAIDAGANAITVEIQDGGKSLIRITDNGSGMNEEDIPLAFTPHATSKIQDATDLLTVSSLGFRGEALASIASVSQLEMVSKTRETLMGSRYECDGGNEGKIENVGCPEGTTFIVRNLFYNTPARLKFLKSAPTEAGYIGGLVERMALSHPDISFRFINQKQTKISTSGNGNLKDVIYHIYGRDIAANLVSLDSQEVFCHISGFIGKPVVSRGNRALMNYFINGRYIKSTVIHKAIEEAYAPYTMQHRYPFTALHIQIDPQYIDVNVHPQKMEIRFHNEKEIFQSIYHGISEALKYREFIPEVTFQEKKTEKTRKNLERLEPFEKERIKQNKAEQKISENLCQMEERSEKIPETIRQPENTPADMVKEKQDYMVTPEEPKQTVPVKIEQTTLFDEGILSQKAQKEVKIIGQVFSTYWILQYEDKMYMVDQHAAHEKVLYERFMKEISQRKVMTQLLHPPIVLSLSMSQQQVLEEHEEIFEELGYQIENFGGREYTVSGVPSHLPQVGSQELLLEIIDSLGDEQGRKRTPDILLEKVASMSCKAAVKGNNKLPLEQMQELLKELMTLENPYHCPHGRPTMISMSKTEIEKKFHRIV